jgi:CO dehydrogenase nickel-insertion accessory protein CooC1
MEEKPLAGIRLGLFGKGGAGKSTVTVLLARSLAGRGYHPVVLDADSTNIGLSRALGAQKDPRPLMEHFGGFAFMGGPVTCPVDDPTPLPDAELDLDRLPVEFQSATSRQIRLLVGGKLGHLGPGAGCDGPVAKIARDLRVRTSSRDTVFLADFKAGFEDSARGVILGLDWALVVVDPTTASLQMAVHFDQMVKKLRQGVPPATAHLENPALVEEARRQFRASRVQGVAAILNRLPDTETETFVREQLQRMGGPRVLGALPEDREIQRQWLRGDEVGSEKMEKSIESMTLALEKLLADSLNPEPAG